MLQRFHNTSAFLTVVLSAALASPPATSQDLPPAIHGITLPDTPGAPFSATVVIGSERDWSEDFTEVYRTINLVARDSRGRTHNETRQMMPESFHGSPTLTSVRLFDPQTRIRTIYEPATHIARRQLNPGEPKKNSVPDPLVRVEDLGTTTLNGLSAKGTRRTRTIAVKPTGLRRPIEIVDEIWYSEVLHINLLVRHSDPRFGTDTVGLSNLRREEPPSSMFDVPPGYQILNVEPAAGGSSSNVGPSGAAIP